MKHKIDQFLNTIEALSVRERSLLLVALTTTIVFVFSNLLIGPTMKQVRKLRVEASGKQSQVDFFSAEVNRLVVAARGHPDDENQKRLQELENTLRTVDTNLAQFTHGMVSPREMPKLIEDVLSRDRRLSLLRMENLPVEPLGLDSNSKDPGKDAVLYRHGLRVIMEGRYTDLVEYMVALESLRWSVFWGSARLQVNDKSMSELEIILYTISMDQAWVGV
ncbi:MAG: hypothetical protein OEZ10_10425 [Gammaproteobacteria bacterium]|nr:hypothetical protein [Gammaproteobacteria bacterium]